MRENRTGIPIPRAPSAPARPTRPTGVRARFQSEAAAGVPFAAATPKRQAPVWPLRAEVATMRGRNKMRLAHHKGNRRADAQAGAQNKRGAATPANKLRGTRTAWGFGGRQESPERARSHESGWPWRRKRSLEPRQWSAAERLSRDSEEQRRCCARAAT